MEDEVAGIAAAAVPYPFNSGADLLRTCTETGLTIAQVQMENERALRSEAEILAGLDTIRDAMLACIARGLRMEGELPGGLKVRCRVRRLHETLEAARLTNSRPAHEIMDWISLFALAVNEENASGWRTDGNGSPRCVAPHPCLGPVDGLRRAERKFPRPRATGGRSYPAARIFGMSGQDPSL